MLRALNTRQNAKLTAGTVLRAAGLDPGGLQLILLVASDHEYWARARSAAMTRAVQDPASAVAALDLEVQWLGRWWSPGRGPGIPGHRAGPG
jgi:hypothetical protein